MINFAIQWNSLSLPLTALCIKAVAQIVLSPLHGKSSERKVEFMIACATTLSTIVLNSGLAHGTFA